MGDVGKIDADTIDAIRKQAVAEYKAKMVESLRSTGAVVRRLLSYEIEAGKHD